MNSFPERVVITPGSKASFWLDVEDEVTGEGIPLFQKITKAVFCNCAGDRIEITLDTDNDSARCGSVFIEIPAVETAKFDKRSIDFDLEYLEGTEPIIIPIDKMIELKERNCPASS